MLHGIHSVFPPPDVTGHPGGNSVAEKKLENGKGLWAFTKEILGWIFDGKEYTIQLPDKKCDRIIALLKKLLLHKSTPLKQFEELTGKLQHAAYSIPGGAGLLSLLQEAMKGAPAFITITPLLREALKDWSTIIKYLKTHPTS
eukprot:5827235-Ditylum_brightwellii.AAC.1